MAASPRAAPAASPRIGSASPRAPDKERRVQQPGNTVCLGDGRTQRAPLLGGVMAVHASAVGASGSRLFAPCGNVALGFSARTSRRLGALGPHQGQVTAVCAGSSRTDCMDSMVTGSSFGEVKLWDGRGSVCLSTLEFDRPVLALSWPQPETILVVLGEAGKEAVLESADVPSLEGARKTGRLPLSAKRAGRFDAIEGVAALTDDKVLVLWAKGWESCRRYSHSHSLTAVAVDPLRRYVAVGDEKGVVWTWWGILDGEGEDKTPRVPARWHWHASAVRALAHSGPVLLSGGAEGVLCIRNSEDESLHFIPRFAAGLRHITVAAGNRLVCCSLEDNSLALIDDLHGWIRPRYIHTLDVPVSPGASSEARLESRFSKKKHKLKKEKQEQPQDELEKKPPSRPVLHSLVSGGLAVTVSGRRVQFFDATGQPQAGKPMALERGGSANSDPMQRWALRQLAFSAHASCIMTCESRLSPALERFDAESAHSCVLKWWRREEGNYILDSISNNPHKADVTVALANPHQENMFATASSDGSFKLWDRLPVSGAKSSSNGARELQCWQCIAVGSWRMQPILAGCFGADGSTLATGVSGFIVLWEAEGGTELQPLPLAEVGDKPEQLCSVVACERFLLLACVRRQNGSDEILCWDLGALEVVARLDLGLALRGMERCEMRCTIPAGSGGAMQLLAFRQSEAALVAWRLTPGGAGEAPAFVEQASATLPSGHRVLDVAFVSKDTTDEGCHLLCWTSLSELWELDLSPPGTVVKEKRPSDEPELDEETATSSRSGVLSGLVGGRTAVPGVAAGPPRLLKLPLRTTGAQQAGLVPRLVQKVVPPNVPSHMLPPPSVLWAGLLSVYAKPPDGGLPSSVSVRAENGQEAGVSTSLSAEKAALGQEGSGLPPWVRKSRMQEAEPELVDANWMDKLVASAFDKKK